MRPPSRRRGSKKKPSAERSASPRSEADRRAAAAERASDETAAKREPAGETAAEKLPKRRARMARPRQQWGRRTVAVGVVLVAAALFGGVLLLILGSDDNGGDGGETPKQAVDLQDKYLKHTVVDAEKGISVRRPKNWSDRKNDHVITLRSRDGCVAMTLAAPGGSDEAGQLHDQSLTLFRHTFDAKINPAPDSKVGGIPTKSDRIVFHRGGHRIAVLLSVGKGDKNTYLTETVVRDPSCRGSLQLAQLVQTSIEYTK